MELDQPIQVLAGGLGTLPKVSCNARGSKTDAQASRIENVFTQVEEARYTDESTPGKTSTFRSSRHVSRKWDEPALKKPIEKTEAALGGDHKPLPNAKATQRKLRGRGTATEKTVAGSENSGNA